MHSEAFLSPGQKLAARVITEFPRKPPRIFARIIMTIAWLIPVLILVGIAQ